MIKEEIKNIRGTISDYKKFGYLLGVIFLSWGAVIFITRSIIDWRLLLGILFFGSALVRPTVLAYPYKVWMIFGVALGFIVTRIILFLLYFIILTPVSLIGKLFGKRFLNLRHDPLASTYWHIRQVEEYKPKQTETQY